MKKRITYEIHGQIERNCYFRIGKALVRVEFTGGSINSTGVYPAHYITENALFQRAIENSEAYRSGEIKQGKVEILDDGKDVAQGVNEEAGDVTVIPEVTNLQQARNILISEPYNCQLSQLQNKNAVKLVAAEKGVSFPNWI
ncbi:MAG: hypothetical protein J6U58_07485 [Bacteroidaceae bacterium]|nr:hypothetical protein [Bacteroidaceae bacterium]